VLPNDSTGQGPGTLAEKLSRCKEGMAHFLPVKAQGYLRFTSVAVQGFSEPRIYPLLQSWWRALAQCRGTNYLGARNLSRCRILIASRCACPGATAITNLSWVQELKQKVWQTTYLYCPCYGAFYC